MDEWELEPQGATTAVDSVKACSILDPECEACQ